MEYVKLGDVYKISKGKKVEQIDELTDKSVRYIQIDDLRNDNNIKHCENNPQYVFAKKEDIIIAWDGANAGTISYGLEGAIGSTLATLKSTNNEFLSRYVGKFLQSKFSYLRATCTGATIPHISREALVGIEIPKVPLETQQKIADTLDIAQQLINNRKQQITELDNLTQSIFYDMFGDPIVNKKSFQKIKMLEVCRKITDGTHHSPPNVVEGVPYVSAKHLGSGKLDFYSKPVFVSVESHKEIYSRCNPEKGDVLYIKDGATTGIAGLNHYEFEFSMLSSLALLKLKKEVINAYFMVAILNYPSVKFNITSEMAGGAIKRLTLVKIKNIELILPPLELQNKFADIAQKIEEQKAALEQSLAELENNFKSIMQQSFANVSLK